MGLFGKGGVVGLEFDTGLIRAVEVRGKNGSAKVVAGGQVPVPDSAVSDGIVQEPEVVADALQKLWSKAGIGSKNVVLGMFNQGVIMRLINFPKVPKDKLEQALRLQAGEYFPIPLSQMILDFAVVGEVENNGAEQYEVLLVAAKKTHMEPSLEALKKAKLNVDVVDATPLALMRALPKEKLEGTVVLVDLAMGLSNLLLSIDGMPRFARVIPVNLKQYVNNVGASLEVQADYQQYVAAALEKEAGEEFARWGNGVAREIRASISFYVKTDNLEDVDRVILSGKGAKVIGLADLLSEDLNVPVEVVQPMANVDSKAELEGPEFAVCVGLALRGLEV
ncbi:type IV pilus biogenesis protein PilM [Dethiobacter alkaliphilus]|uniref:Type IV pilus assembly protein PilM n=1 Tax=Dethiobacter alkaliphilus AHT 1 TaxID=555088 RepID=C0GE60_DETAL|nr:type IV pilus assembly protein PilM [Dethiobacter alkaliphilus]EEG78354.1 type IV pilus assembly protein PilM [Dethiobacter alkaliphilus AHT 1]